MSNYERRTQRVLREILSMTYTPGNGGYASDFGPITFGEMLTLTRCPEFPSMQGVRDWASGVGSCGVTMAGGNGRLGCEIHRCGNAVHHLGYHSCGEPLCGTSWSTGGLE